MCVPVCIYAYADMCRGQKRAPDVLPYHSLLSLWVMVSLWCWSYCFLLGRSPANHSDHSVSSCFEAKVTGVSGVPGFLSSCWDGSELSTLWPYSNLMTLTACGNPLFSPRFLNLKAELVLFFSHYFPIVLQMLFILCLPFWTMGFLQCWVHVVLRFKTSWMFSELNVQIA